MRYVLLIPLLLAACSDHEREREIVNVPSIDISLTTPTNTAQVIHEGLPDPTYIPTLAEVFRTDRTSHWLCSFADASGMFFWQTVLYFYDGNGESVFNNIPADPNFPNHFEFLWAGEQALSVASDIGYNFTIFGFRYDTEPDEVLSDAIIYQFTAEHSFGGVVVCAKIEGER